MHTGRFSAVLCSGLLAVVAGLTGAAPVTPAHAASLAAPAPASPAHSAPGHAAPAHAVPPAAATRVAPAVSAKSAILIDGATGTVHYQKGADRRRPVASLTKVMTAYVVLSEGADLNERIRITAADARYPAATGAAGSGFRKGERPTVRDLLHGLMLSSGADASQALIRRYGPGRSAFVAKMNNAAHTLGLANTHYVNPDGMPKPAKGNYSTARDQAALTKIALAHPQLAKIAATRKYTIRKSSHTRGRALTNTNKLLGTVSGAVGMKTGYTNPAGWCLSFAVDRGGKRYIGVVLGDTGAQRRFSTATKLINWASSS
ncbi:D-alanyl-D-alanine carboxypeptidase family protein [Sinosporangium siamense]|nr:D-alanyl-D-alanine carboxypeptidase family protein [Sinosporangium siamense]